ncbi:hypothetical protein WME76_35305 [Sorangium sp. So ce119]|uniref:alpha/beta fold hydrolase n=1 Tax=Sorangium sp. So ce119 TaxID=3133279 RepID=UPI003F6425E8
MPILAMNGLLDPQTPIGQAELAADRLTAPHHTFVAVPWSPHVVTFESPVKTADAAPCGTQMMAKFIADPEAPVDTTCLDDLVPVTWDEDPAVVEMLFGTKDMWENTASPAPRRGTWRRSTGRPSRASCVKGASASRADPYIPWMPAGPLAPLPTNGFRLTSTAMETATMCWSSKVPRSGAMPRGEAPSRRR